MTDPTANSFPEQVPLLPDGEFLPSPVGGERPLDPARAYLLSLNSPRSPQTMESFLGSVARMLGAANFCQRTARKRRGLNYCQGCNGSCQNNNDTTV